MPLKIRRINKTDNWLTPPELVKSLGTFDLDPCSSASQGNELAKLNFRLPEHNGLLEPWQGRVWCNPPFSEMKAWASRFVLHANGIMICPLRMRTKWSQILFDHSDGILFLRDEVRWISPDGITKLGDLFDFALYAIGEDNVKALKKSFYKGILWERSLPSRLAAAELGWA